MTAESRHDIVVMGGGPSGSAAAFALARAGLRVALLERTHFDDWRVGELLVPEIAGPLQAMGVWGRFRDDGHLPVASMVTSWGDAEPSVHDFLRSPFGVAWVVDRCRFDRLLFDAAEAAGARTFPGTVVRRCHREGGAWLIEARQEDRVVRLRASYVVDATGRGRGVRSGGRTAADHLTACLCYLEPAPGDMANAAVPILESTRDGWWFSTALPGGGRVIAFFTDRDRRASACSLTASEFWRRLEHAPLTREQLPPAPSKHTFHRRAADSQYRPASDPGRMAVGDALMSLDPLSGRGVVAAMESGRDAAAAIVAAVRGSDCSIREYADDGQRRFERYLVDRDHYYQDEPRWPLAPFWVRRQRSAQRLVQTLA